MEILFQNPLLLLLAIFIIARVFKSISGSSAQSQKSKQQNSRDASQNQPKNQKSSQTPKKRSFLDELKHQFEEAVEEVKDKPKDVGNQQSAQRTYQEASTTTSNIKDRIEEQQKKQFAHLKQEIADQSHSGFDQKELNQDFSGLKKPLTQSEKDRLSIKKNLTQKGLKQSIVMLEVLGPPRALKPYRSVYKERYRSK